MKLDDWKFRKNTPRHRRDPGERQPPKVLNNPSLTPPDMSPSPNMCSQMPNNEFLPTFPTALDERSSDTVQSISSHPADTTSWSNSSLNMAHETSHYSLYNLPSLRANFLEGCPLINSSLMFLSTRRPIDSLQLLAKSPELAPQALEIVLRNWKPGLDHLFYISRFLQHSSYCHTIVGVNWTRWSHSDETLFDLVDEFVPEEDQNLVRRALLHADFTFGHPLETLKAPWAEVWRLAIRETSWGCAKHLLLKMDVRDQLLRCALGVVAEELMKYHERCLQRLELTDPAFLRSLKQKDRILKDCQRAGIEMDLRNI